MEEKPISQMDAEEFLEHLIKITEKIIIVNNDDWTKD